MPDSSENGGKKPDSVTKPDKNPKKLQNSKMDDHTYQSNNYNHTGQSKQRRSPRSVENHGDHADQPSTHSPAMTLHAMPSQNTTKKLSKTARKCGKNSKTLSKPLGGHTDQPTQKTLGGHTDQPPQKHPAVTQTSRLQHMQPPAMMPRTMPSPKHAKTGKKRHKTHLNVTQQSPQGFPHKTGNKQTTHTM